MKTYLKKNGFFVFLLTVILFIIIALSVYIFVNMRNDEQAAAEPAQPTPTQTTTKEKAEITQFEGEYNKNLKYINVSWSYEKNASTISSVSLYINDIFVDNVQSYSSYQISKDVFHYPTGDNELRLVLNLSDGSTVETKTDVFVNYVVSMEQRVKQVENATEVTLCYQYDEAHTVEVPNIFITDASIVGVDVQYVGTTKTSKDGSVFAETTYRIVWQETPVSYQRFSIRWSFKDISYSKDFEAEKGIASQEVGE